MQIAWLIEPVRFVAQGGDFECNVASDGKFFGRQIIFCTTPVGARLIFSMLLLGTELILAKLPPGAGLFVESEKRRDPRELSCL